MDASLPEVKMAQRASGQVWRSISLYQWDSNKSYFLTDLWFSSVSPIRSMHVGYPPSPSLILCFSRPRSRVRRGQVAVGSLYLTDISMTVLAT